MKNNMIGLPEILLFCLIGCVVYFLLIRPQQKKQKQIQAMREEKERRKAMQYRKDTVPDTCPHCKNSNLKKSHECVWCGNKIIE
jgi:hypothetical protein